jgi:hypothetical protein
MYPQPPRKLSYPGNGLAEAAPEQLLAVEVPPSGYGLHWESLDVDLAAPAILGGLCGTQV